MIWSTLHSSRREDGQLWRPCHLTERARVCHCGPWGAVGREWRSHIVADQAMTQRPSTPRLRDKDPAKAIRTAHLFQALGKLSVSFLNATHVHAAPRASMAANNKMPVESVPETKRNPMKNAA